MRQRPARPNIVPVFLATVICLALGWFGFATQGKGSFLALLMPLGGLLGFGGIAYYFGWTPRTDQQPSTQDRPLAPRDPDH